MVLSCLLLVFAVQSSFLYEVVDIEMLFADRVQIIQTPDVQNILGEGSLHSLEEIPEPEENFAKTESDEENTEETLGEITEETYTLEDVLSASQGSSKIEPRSTVSGNESEKAQTENIPETLHKSDWNLILVNKQHPIPEDYTFTLGTIKGSMKCDERILMQLGEMMQAARSVGVTLVIRSPYRNDARQEYLFDRKVKNNMKKKMSYLEAFRAGAQAVTIPGSSEHQIGLALDIVSDTYTMLDEGFADTDAGKWLADNSYRYGFILRYPKGKEDITGIAFEPWHFRYVDVPAATYIYQNQLSLEEFVQLLGE